MLEFCTSVGFNFKSLEMVTVNLSNVSDLLSSIAGITDSHTSGGNAYLPVSVGTIRRSFDRTYQDQKATKKPNQAKLNTRPYTLIGLRIGIERALPLTGLISGAFHRRAGLKPMVNDQRGVSNQEKSSLFLPLRSLYVSDIITLGDYCSKWNAAELSKLDVDEETRPINRQTTG